MEKEFTETNLFNTGMEATMTPRQRGYWKSLDLSKQETSNAIAHQLVSKCARKSIDPEVFRMMKHLKKKIHSEVRRLGGSWDRSERSIANMLKNLEESILSAVVPEEVVDLKYPPGID